MMDARGKAVAVSDADDAAVVAESLRVDFARLISIFDRELDDAATARENGAMTHARVAAKRGLRLSEELAGLLRNMR
jgi:hypothetical protein